MDVSQIDETSDEYLYSQVSYFLFSVEQYHIEC